MKRERKKLDEREQANSFLSPLPLSLLLFSRKASTKCVGVDWSGQSRNVINIIFLFIKLPFPFISEESLVDFYCYYLGQGKQSEEKRKEHFNMTQFFCGIFRDNEGANIRQYPYRGLIEAMKMNFFSPFSASSFFCAIIKKKLTAKWTFINFFPLFFPHPACSSSRIWVLSSVVMGFDGVFGFIWQRLKMKICKNYGRNKFKDVDEGRRKEEKKVHSLS